MIITRQGDILRPSQCNFHLTDVKKEGRVNEDTGNQRECTSCFMTGARLGELHLEAHITQN